MKRDATLKALSQIHTAPPANANKKACKQALAAEKWEVYNMIISQCGQLPWQVIPSDKRWYRNYAVAKILTEHLEKL